MRRALALGFGGYADLDLTFGEFFQQDHTITTRYLPHHPYAGPGPFLAENGGGTYAIGQGDYRWGSGGFKVLGPSTLFVQVGNSRVVYEVPDFVNEVAGPVGYRDVWQHMTVRRQNNLIEVFLNGTKLAPYESSEFTVPTSGGPSDTIPLRIGRRSPGSGDTNFNWQFYGLVDEVAVYTGALSLAQIQQKVAATLTGSEPGLIAGWTFAQGNLPQKLSRPVVLPTAVDIPQHVTEHASYPIPAYLVDISSDLNSTTDSMKVDVRPSKVNTSLPFGAGEWWKVVQGWETPHVSHNGRSAFCWDFRRVNGDTIGSPVFAAAPGRFIFANSEKNAISCYHAPCERVVYMHLPASSYEKFFPNLSDAPQNLPIANQPSYGFHDPIALAPSGNLHFCTSAILGETSTGDSFPEAGGSIPNALEDYYVSHNEGNTWSKVDLGVPKVGQWVARYPYSPWGEQGAILDVAPAVASRKPNRLDVFVRGENDHLWMKGWGGSAWNKWQDMGGGRLTSAPAVVSWGPERLDVFVRGFNHQLAHKRWTKDKGWSNWRDLGGTLSSAPAVASWGPDRLDVFARGDDNQLMHIRWNGKEWSNWRDLGGRLTSAPAAVSWGPGRIDVFVRGFDKQLAHKRWVPKKSWSKWRDLGGRLTSAPAVASWCEGRLDVFVRGHSGGLAHKRWTPDKSWSDWRDLGGRLNSGPAAISWGYDRLDVFVRGFDDQLAHKRWVPEKSWSRWRDLDEG